VQKLCQKAFEWTKKSPQTHGACRLRTGLGCLALQQFQHRLGRLVGLRQHGCGRLRDDL
jgi:hypothetical protein